MIQSPRGEGLSQYFEDQIFAEPLSRAPDPVAICSVRSRDIANSLHLLVIVRLLLLSLEMTDVPSLSLRAFCSRAHCRWAEIMHGKLWS
jgi:hypothetical protein